jgi:hypothetical protein
MVRIRVIVSLSLRSRVSGRVSVRVGLGLELGLCLV